MDPLLQVSRLPWLVLMVVFLGAGCGGSTAPPQPPFPTFPVKGKVAYKNNAGRIERLERGKVWFHSTTDANITAVGSISDDGSFFSGDP